MEEKLIRAFTRPYKISSDQHAQRQEQENERYVILQPGYRCQSLHAHSSNLPSVSQVWTSLAPAILIIDELKQTSKNVNHIMLGFSELGNKLENLTKTMSIRYNPVISKKGIFFDWPMTGPGRSPI